MLDPTRADPTLLHLVDVVVIEHLAKSTPLGPDKVMVDGAASMMTVTTGSARSTTNVEDHAASAWFAFSVCATVVKEAMRMATIEVDEYTKRTVSFAARMANLSESVIIRRLIAAIAVADDERLRPIDQGVSVYADYEGHRVHARYIEPARVEIIDGPLAGRSFKTPTGAARAVVRHYNPDINDNRNGWTFWQIDNESGVRTSLQSVRPGALRSRRGSLQGRIVASDDWDSPEVNESIARDFGLTP